MNKLADLFRAILERINVKAVETFGLNVLLAIAIVLASLLISRRVQRFVDRRLRRDDNNKDEDIRTYKRVIRFIVMTPGLLIAIHVLGFNLSTLFTTSGLFAVALAFALKNIAENYISGIMLRLERTIKRGDVLEIDGMMARVKEIGFRATVVRTKDERDLMVPNSQFVQSQVANYTHKDSVCRVWTDVGVSYSSDMKKVREVLERVCDKFPGQSDYHRPEVHLRNFGDSAVIFKVSIWIENPWESGKVKAQFNEAIWWGLKEADIVIALPQLDLHFDEAFTKAAQDEQHGPDANRKDR